MVVTVGVKDTYLAFSFSSYGPATLVRSGGKIGKTKWALRGSSESKKHLFFFNFREAVDLFTL